MNLFSKSLIVGLFPCALSAQGLYSIAPNDDEATESLPLSYTVGAAFGYDDNPTPLTNSDDGSVFVSGFIQANWTSVTPQDTWDVFARLGVRHFFNSFDSVPGIDDADETSYNATLGVNYTRRVSERLRFSSRNFVTYETEPDFANESPQSARVGNYFRWSTQNTVGYRWTERLGTNTGIDFSGITFDDIDDSDSSTLSLRHQFRYRISPATVLTTQYRYSFTNNDTSRDVDSHFITGGIEHRISPVSAIVLRAGVQVVQPDGGDSRTEPFIEGSIRSQLTQQLGVNAFLRYSSEDFNQQLIVPSQGTTFFEESQTLRFGLRANYVLNHKLSLFGGVSIIHTSYDDVISPVTASDIDETLINWNIGASYQIADNFYVTGSYNFTDAFSDEDLREYDRNRFQLGVQATF